jgi:hypothetical protein
MIFTFPLDCVPYRLRLNIDLNYNRFMGDFGGREKWKVELGMRELVRRLNP